MKNLFLLFVISALIPAQSYGQQILNGDFENWTIDTLYEEPEEYLTTNLQSYFDTGLPNVERASDAQSGSFAAKMVTLPGSQGAITGGMFIGIPGPGGVTGGIPYNEKPVAFQGFLKCNIMPGDTGNIIVFLKRNTNIMAVASVKPTGIQASYVPFSTPLYWLDTVSANYPDTLVVLVSSSDFDNPVSGSELYVDSFNFTGVTTPFPNGGFENWVTNSYENPDGWTTLNMFGLFLGDFSATKSTDSYTGNFALELKTIVIPHDSISDTIGFVTNGRLGDNGPQGGLVVNNYPKKISGFYKYYPAGTDTAVAGAFLNSNTTMIDSSMIKLEPVNVYTYFEMLLTYQGPEIPDTLNITFLSSNSFDSTATPGEGSILLLDNLQIEYFPVSIGNNMEQISDINIYPNPATGKMIISLPDEIFEGGSAYIKICDISGKTVMQFNTSENVTTVNTGSLPAGVYMVKTSVGKNISVNRIIKL